MKLQRYSLHDVDTMDFILMHGAILCKDDDVEALEAENAALHAECDRLTALMHQPHDSTPAVESAWNRFNEAISDGADAPYPGMASAFESYYGQKWNDKDWRRETSVWAAAWKESADRLTAMLSTDDTAMDRYRDVDGGYDRDPIERLRFFCSLALNGQDWLDAEPFFDEITGMMGPQKVLSAEEVTEPGFYWRRYGTEELCIVDVDYGYPYGQMFIWVNGEQEEHALEGQFIGPIKMPEA